MLQLRHASAAEAAPVTPLPKEPTGHGVASMAAAVGQKKPTPHATQAVLSADTTDSSVDPLAYLPGLHAAQVPASFAPTAALHRPTEQGVGARDPAAQYLRRAAGTPQQQRRSVSGEP